MLPPTALSQAARQLRDYLATGLAIPGKVMIGHPKGSASRAEGKVGEQFLNLFFFRIEYGGYPADGSAGDPFFVRLHCMITALGNQEPNNGTSISAGENDLRLIGGAMQLLHSNPSLSLADDTGQEIARLQVVVSPFSLDEINNLWSTQADTSYRLSVAYELALVPLPLAVRQETSPRVGAIGLAAHGNPDFVPLPSKGFGLGATPPTVPKIGVDVRRPDWTPRICIEVNGELSYSLAHVEGQVPTEVGIIAVGELGKKLELVWERWDRNQGWRTVQTAQIVEIDVTTDTVDPAATDDNKQLSKKVNLPNRDQGQLLLHAQRQVDRPDGTTVTLRSNPLLVTIHPVAPA